VGGEGQAAEWEDQVSTEKKVLTIVRSKWRRGGETGNLNQQFGRTKLLNQKGQMCCLGFDALACGVPKKRIADVEEPIGIPGVTLRGAYGKSRLKKGRYGLDHKKAVEQAIEANDNPHISEEKREKLVRKYLKQLGWADVKFVD
jgi:hypothetical protein